MKAGETGTAEIKITLAENDSIDNYTQVWIFLYWLDRLNKRQEFLVYVKDNSDENLHVDFKDKAPELTIVTPDPSKLYEAILTFQINPSDTESQEDLQDKRLYVEVVAVNNSSEIVKTQESIVLDDISSSVSTGRI